VQFEQKFYVKCKFEQKFYVTFQADEVCAPSGIESALDTVRELNENVTAYSNEAKDHMLFPLPGQAMQICSQELGSSTKLIGGAMAQLLTAATQVT